MIDLEKEREAFIKLYTEIYGEHDEIWQGWKSRAELAQQEISELKAKLAKYESKDVVVVPREPTQLMLDAFPEVEINDTYIENYTHFISDEEITKGYQAMVEAGEVK